jgi:RHS repeat-associated protein
VGDWNSITTNGTAQNRTPHMLPHARQPFIDRICPDLSCPSSSSSLSPHVSGLLPDFDNKLKSADVDNNGSNDVTFQYDALGRRVARQGTSGSFVYVQHDQQTIADYGYGDAPSSPTHRYVYASYIDELVVRKAAGTSGTIYYLHRNQQFSITAVTTSSGSVAERYAYTAYGQPTILDGSGSVLSSSAINNRYTYTGREWDATLGLYHFRARWMSGLAGRFMGRDPIGYADGYNIYMSYLQLVSMDAFGTETEDDENWNYTDLEYGTSILGYYYRAVSDAGDWKPGNKVVDFPLNEIRCCPGRTREGAVSLSVNVSLQLGFLSNAYLEWLELSPEAGLGVSISHSHNMQCDGTKDTILRPRVTLTYEYRRTRTRFDYQVQEYGWVFDPYPRYTMVNRYWQHWYTTYGWEVRNVRAIWDDFEVPIPPGAPPCPCEKK